MLSRKRIAVLVFSLALVVVVAAGSVWTVITPEWSFTVTTKRNTFRLGENVEITVSLKNMGFIAHSFKTRIKDLAVISIEYQYAVNIHSPLERVQVWCTPFQLGVTEFSVGPGVSLERSVVWNQTRSLNTWVEEEIEIGVGVYWIHAFVPEYPLGEEPMGVDNIFSAWAFIYIVDI